LLEEDGRFRVVCGFRRLEALRRLKASKVIARIFEDGKIGYLEAFEFALWDNLSHRQLEPLEKARAVYKLKNVFGVSGETLIQKYLPILDLPAHDQSLRAHVMLHASLPELRGLFREGRLTLASMEWLSLMPAESMGEIAVVLPKMRLSASLQRKFFNLLEDLSTINKSKPIEILKDPQVTAVLENNRLTPGERGERVYTILYRLRYPTVSDAGKRFLERKRSLGLPGSVRISADPYFEKPDIHVEFTVRDAEHFRQLAKKLREATEKPELDLLFHIFE
jgi:hypothetical protein